MGSIKGLIKTEEERANFIINNIYFIIYFIFN
jgi:hypothetical protein